MIDITRKFQKIVPTGHGNVFVGESLLLRVRAKSISEYYKKVDRILDDGVYVEVN